MVVDDDDDVVVVDDDDDDVVVVFDNDDDDDDDDDVVVVVDNDDDDDDDDDVVVDYDDVVDDDDDVVVDDDDVDVVVASADVARFVCNNRLLKGLDRNSMARGLAAVCLSFLFTIFIGFNSYLITFQSITCHFNHFIILPALQQWNQFMPEKQVE